MGRELRTAGNEGDQNKIGAFNQSVKIGNALQLGAQTVSGTVTTNTMVLPQGGKALVAISCFVSAGGVTGVFDPAAVGVAPATGEVGVSVTGDLVFFAADAVTRAEVVYTVMEGSVVSASAVIVAGSALLPNVSKARMLLSATAGGNARTVLARAAAPGVGQAAVSLTGAAVTFNVADNGLKAVVTYIELPVLSVAQSLTAEVDF